MNHSLIRYSIKNILDPVKKFGIETKSTGLFRGLTEHEPKPPETIPEAWLDHECKSIIDLINHSLDKSAVNPNGKKQNFWTKEIRELRTKV